MCLLPGGCVSVSGWMLPAGANGPAETGGGGAEVCGDAEGVQTPGADPVQTPGHPGQ